MDEDQVSVDKADSSEEEDPEEVTRTYFFWDEEDEEHEGCAFHAPDREAGCFMCDNYLH